MQYVSGQGMQNAVVPFTAVPVGVHPTYSMPRLLGRPGCAVLCWFWGLVEMDVNGIVKGQKVSEANEASL